MIAFPSGIRYAIVTPDGDRTPKDAYLFDASGVENKKLSLSFKVSAFKHASQDLFRADPVLFKCVQKVQNAMQKEDERVSIMSGAGWGGKTRGTHICDTIKRNESRVGNIWFQLFKYELLVHFKC